MVGTFHAYSSSWLPNTIARAIGARRVFNRLHARIAVSEAARWTGERYFGGTLRRDPERRRHERGAARAEAARPTRCASCSSVARRSARDCPVLLSAFAGLRQHIPVRLQVIGAEADGVEPLLAQVEGGMDGIEVLGRVDDAELWRRLHAADVLCAPSLGGESFGMVLTEAFAAGTPVVASDIAGYRQVVTHGRDGLLVHARRPAGAGRGAALAVARPGAPRPDGRRRARSVPRTSRGRRSRARSPSVYERAVAAPAPVGPRRRRASRPGSCSGDLAPSPPGTPPAVDRARSAEGAARLARAGRRAPRRARTVGDRRRAARLPGAAPGRLRQRRRRRCCTRARSGC